MCSQHPLKTAWYLRRSVLFTIATLLALISANCGVAFVLACASFVADVFMKLLKLVSIPILFFSLMSILSSIEGGKDTGRIVRRIVRYTFGTTMIAATIGLFCVYTFDLFNEQHRIMTLEAPLVEAPKTHYSELVLNAIPSNIIGPFADNNAIAALSLALLLGLSASKLPTEPRTTVHAIVRSLYQLLMQTTLSIIKALPVVLWAFLTLLFHQLWNMESAEVLLKYLSAVLCANIVQGVVVLPLLLLAKGISPRKLAAAFFPALSTAFVTKSSSATVPVAIRCALANTSIRESTASLSFPLCTSINMNGCAAFILITVLFVGTVNGVSFTLIDQFVWLFVATFAAIGNAGVPMGCYFLSSALLASMGVPLNIMGAILPFYAIIDAVETALNVWSDCSITAIVDKH